MAGRNGNKRPAPKKRAAPRRRPNGRRSKVNAATNALTPGTGAAPIVPFGSSAAARAQLSVLDATHPSHMPLPRSVGPYCVTRTTCRFSSSARVILFGFTNYHGSAIAATQGKWSNVIAYADVDAASSISGNNNARLFSAPAPEGASGTCVPSAITVQIMNPNPLQTTSGICYMGVSKTQLPIKGETKTWDALGDELISYMAPRLVAAPKLALNGVKVSSYPMNMSSLADFTEVVPSITGAVTTLDAPANAPDFNGFAPIFVVNSGGAALEYLVTVEWRTRFSITTPAASAHRHYPATPDKVFDGVVRAASSLGHGVMDIADSISRIGQAANTVRSALGGPRNPLPLMVD